jgi:hypothetical protein
MAINVQNGMITNLAQLRAMGNGNDDNGNGNDKKEEVAGDNNPGNKSPEDGGKDGLLDTNGEGWHGNKP